MDHQDRIYFKGLAFLYGKEEVPFQEYRTHLEKVLGESWHNIYQEMDRLGYLKLRRIVSSSNNNVPHSYNITEAGITFYESILQELEDIDKEDKQGTSRTNWTRIIGWGTIILIGMTGYLIWLEYHPQESKAYQPYSKAMDSATRAKFDRMNDSARKLISDSSSKAHTTDNNITDSAKAEVIGVDGKPVVYSNDPPPPPPPREYKKKRMQHHKIGGDTLNVSELPALQKEIEKNTGKPIK